MRRVSSGRVVASVKSISMSTSVSTPSSLGVTISVPHIEGRASSASVATAGLLVVVNFSLAAIPVILLSSSTRVSSMIITWSSSRSMSLT